MAISDDRYEWLKEKIALQAFEKDSAKPLEDIKILENNRYALLKIKNNNKKKIIYPKGTTHSYFPY